MRIRFSWKLLSLFSVSCLFLAGCGGASRPPLGFVSGIVTFDGEPVENITVAMKPENGRTAIARTDSKGHYEIEYSAGEKGTKVGPTQVYVEWPTGVAGEFFIPKKFAVGNKDTKLDVKAGKQTFDLEMQGDADKAGKKPILVD